MPISGFDFGPFELDLTSARLLRDGRPLSVRARDLAVLRYLVVRSGQLVSADELLESVWADTFVVRGVVKATLHRLRSALGDSQPAATYIETVGRLGYRFIAPVHARNVALRAPAAEAERAGATVAALCSRFAAARQDGPQIVFLTGTSRETQATLQEFLAHVEGELAPWVARSLCTLQLGPTEAYRPVLDALRSLCRGPLSAEVVSALRRHAPLWLARLPGLVSPNTHRVLAQEAIGASADRLLRELQDAVDALAAMRPLLLVLEDLHWADRGTLDALAALAARRSPLPFLLVASCDWSRRDDPTSPLSVVLHSLVERGLADELVLGRSEHDVSLDAPRSGSAPARLRASRMPFVGREVELARLNGCLERTRLGSGSIELLAGEAGIGKTRLLEEFAARARAAGARTLSGRCQEGELARPFGPIAEVIEAYADESDEAALREDLGAFGGVVAALAPALRARLPDLAEPPPLSPDDERRRQLDALAQVLWAIARRGPLVVLLDDLHWADAGTLAFLRLAARFLRRRALLIVGGYRDDELESASGLSGLVAALRRELELEPIDLSGLERDALASLIRALDLGDAPAAFVDALHAGTAGNPLFCRELLRDLLEAGGIGAEREANAWRLPAPLSVPEGVRDVVARRLARLPEAANRLLAAAAGCPGPFRFDVASRVAELDETSGLDGLDAALAAQLVRESGEPERYEFTHSLVRHALYTDLSSSRRQRLHRRLAEEMERVDSAGSDDLLLEIAQHWHRSAALPGAEAGVRPCLLVAARAEQAAAYEDAATALRMALDLAPPADPRRARILGRLGRACAWTLAHDEAVRVSLDAAERIAADEGEEVAADYLAETAEALYGSTFDARAWLLAERGLRFIGTRHDLTWARLTVLDLDRRDASDPENPGVPLDVPQRREASRILMANWADLDASGIGFFPGATVFDSRKDAGDRGGASAVVVGFWLGEYRRAIAMMEKSVPRYLERGQLALAALALMSIARCKLALGHPSAATEEYAAAWDLVERIGSPPFMVVQMGGVPLELAMFRGEGYRAHVAGIQAALATAAPENRWIVAMITAFGAIFCAHAGLAEDAIAFVARTMPAIERAPGWAPNYTASVCYLVEALWVLGRRDFAAELESNLREKTLAPDFRYVNVDARAALARLCALTGRVDEARAWFAEARCVLEEQGARPLLAIVDFDEARMERKHDAAGQRPRADALLARAREAFASLGMTGWLRRAESL